MLRRLAPASPPAQRDMCWIPAGRFTMGSERHYREERPCRKVEVAGFWIDRAPVTNRDFANFVAATGYVTFAEQAPTAADYPDAPVENLRAGSMVFRSPPAAAETCAWWHFVHGADWRHPRGPESSIAELDDHPVVHVAWADVAAYAAWAGTALPSEAEWEYAARGGLEGAEFAWGHRLVPEGRHMANVWQGRFPYNDTGADGWSGTSPVGFYPPNGYGLIDMIGNVWEWTCDWWGLADTPTSCCSAARDASVAADDPFRIPRKVLKGGSHLCAPNYCRRYRPAARHAQPIDTSAVHVGFRCVVRP